MQVLKVERLTCLATFANRMKATLLAIFRKKFVVPFAMGSP